MYGYGGNHIIVVESSASRSTATLMKTGQTTQYRLGDDGDIQAGRATSFLVLDTAPTHNSGAATLNTTTNRFTDELGGQTYTNNIVLDWSTWNGATLLGWNRTERINRTWNQLIDEALAASIGGFTSGWRVPNVTEMQSRMNYSVGTVTNYPPFNYSTVVNLWTSTTVPSNTANAFVLGNTGNGNIVGFGKTNVSYGFYCRTFSLSTSNVLS